jgi:hypothetical protein
MHGRDCIDNSMDRDQILSRLLCLDSNASINASQSAITLAPFCAISRHSRLP